MNEPDSIIQPPLTPELDLHTFRPAELSTLLPEYFHECQLRRWHRVRIIHGKGTGALRETVHRLLRTAPEVESFALAESTAGGWGATWIQLRPLAK